MRINFKVGDVIRHKPSGHIGRILHAPDGTDKMYWKIKWLSTYDIDAILTDWFVYEHLEFCELGTILDMKDDFLSELALCKRYFEQPYNQKSR